MSLYRNSIVALTVFGTLALATAANAQENGGSNRRFRIGPQIGTFFPTNSRTRDRFGDNWFEIGVGFGKIQDAEEAATRGRTSFGMNIISESNGDNRATLVPLGYGYRKTLSTGALSPYVGVSGHLLLADIRVPSEDIKSGIRAGGGVSAVVGTTLSKNAFAEAQYYVFSKIRGYDFSGLELKAGLRF